MYFNQESILLSYRHSFHAGNFADIIKHIVQVEILEHLTKKDKPFTYIDTHSGAGLFNLNSEHARKLEEYAGGISKLEAQDWPELARYFEVIEEHNDGNAAGAYYPGSPLIAQDFLRGLDKAWLYELHPEDFQRLKHNIGHDRRVQVKHEDGFQGLLGLVPPPARRGLVLIDPSYEIKADYDQVFKVVNTAYKKFSTGTYAIWYPMVNRQQIDDLERNFVHSGIRDIQRFELGLAADSHGHGMTATGMIVINPPWGLMDKMSAVLPKLVDVLGESDEAFYKADVLVAE